MEIEEATDTISFSLDENNGMQVAEFVKWAQELTDRVFTFNENEMQSAGQGAGEVSFLGTLRIKRERFKEDFFSFFQTMLYIKGFAVVPRGEGTLEMLEIVSMSGPRNREVTNGARYVTPDELPIYRNQTGVPILTTVTLKNINATIATNALRPFFASTGSPTGGGGPTLGNVGNNTAMLIQGFGPQVYAAVKLLELVDVPTEEPNLVVQVIALEHQAPEELEPILTDVLESRDGYRRTFAGFDAQRIARYDEDDRARLMADAGIVRNRLKIDATIGNARALLALHERGGSLSDLLWDAVGGQPMVNHWRRLGYCPSSTPLSDQLSKELARLGFRFVGSTIVYAWM